MSAPDVDDVTAYLGDDGGSWDDDVLDAALAAEKAAQSARCRVPADDADWPADLAEALLRRVARNLFMRSLPSGMQESETGFTRVGGDPEVRRLEAPHRKVVVG